MGAARLLISRSNPFRRSGSAVRPEAQGVTWGVTEPLVSPEPARTRGGYGLVNVRQRLEGYFDSNASLTVDRDAAAGLTTVSVSLPLVRQEPRSQPAAEQVR